MVDLIFEASCSTLHSRHPLGWRSVNKWWNCCSNTSLTLTFCVLCWQAQLMFPDIRILCQHQTSRLRFINPMDYCKSLCCCCKLFGLSFHVRCWWSPWRLLQGHCGMFGWRLCSKLPWFLVLLDLPGECTNSCVRMGSLILVEVVGLGEEWWLTCVFISSLTKDLFKGTWLVTAVWVLQAALFPDPSFADPRSFCP